MSNFETINCSCGTQYLTKDYISSCPSCKKTNYSANMGLFLILLVVAIAILAGFLFGSLAWVIYSIYSKSSKWQFLGATILGLVAIYFFEQIYPYNEYPIMNWISYLCNGAAIGIGIYMYIKSTQSKTN